jgi:hypothetical protein
MADGLGVVFPFEKCHEPSAFRTVLGSPPIFHCFTLDFLLKEPPMLRVSFFCCLTGLSLATNANAQSHSDMEFGYDNLTSPTAFVIEQPNVTAEGLHYFESSMELLDPFNAVDFSADEPGFANNVDENLLLNSNDNLFISALDASSISSFGKGYVNYFDPNTGLLSATGRIGVQDNSSSTADLILQGNSIESGPNQQFLGTAIGGAVHDHLIFDLLDDSTAPLGAYGLLVQLQSDFSSVPGNGIDLTSDPFWLIFNHGMEPSAFDSQALPSFGVRAVPEPGSALLMLLGLTPVLLVRRRFVQCF